MGTVSHGVSITWRIMEISNDHGKARPWRKWYLGIQEEEIMVWIRCPSSGTRVTNDICYRKESDRCNKYKFVKVPSSHNTVQYGCDGLLPTDSTQAYLQGWEFNAKMKSGRLSSSSLLSVSSLWTTGRTSRRALSFIDTSTKSLSIRCKWRLVNTLQPYRSWRSLSIGFAWEVHL